MVITLSKRITNQELKIETTDNKVIKESLRVKPEELE